MDYSPTRKTIDVALTEPWKISISKTLRIGEVVKVDVNEAKFIRAKDRKEEKVNLSDLLGISVIVKGNYHKTANIFYGLKITLLQEPSGYTIGKGVIKSVGQNSFTIEVKGAGGDVITRIIYVLPTTVYLKEGAGRVTFANLKPGMKAEVKGYLWRGAYYAVLVALSAQ